MIKILYDHQIFGFQAYGGVSRYFYELGRRVGASLGFSATVVAPLYVNNYLGQGGLRTVGIHIPDIAKTRRFVGAVNRRISPAVCGVGAPVVLSDLYYQKRSLAPKGCPTVVTVYDMIDEKFGMESELPDRISTAKRSAVARADRIICISENTRKDLIDLFEVDPTKVSTIHLGFSLMDNAGPLVAPEIPKPFFLYVGQRPGYKNFAGLLGAYAASPQIRKEFDLISFGPRGFTPKEKANIRALGLGPMQVRHLSGDDAALAYLYANATAFVYPSLYEGFGLPPLEAMSCKCPVLCSNTSSMPEVVGDAGLYFDPSDSDAIRVAMERVAASADLRLELITRGLARVQHFSYDRCVAQTLNLYRDLRG